MPCENLSKIDSPCQLNSLDTQTHSAYKGIAPLERDMPKANEVATELRRIADALDKEPDAELPSARLWLHADDKSTFLSAVRLMPRPLKKSIFRPVSEYSDIHVEHIAPSVSVLAAV